MAVDFWLYYFCWQWWWWWLILMESDVPLWTAENQLKQLAKLATRSWGKQILTKVGEKFTTLAWLTVIRERTDDGWCGRYTVDYGKLVVVVSNAWLLPMKNKKKRLLMIVEKPASNCATELWLQLKSVNLSNLISIALPFSTLFRFLSLSLSSSLVFSLCHTSNRLRNCTQTRQGEWAGSLNCRSYQRPHTLAHPLAHTHIYTRAHIRPGSMISLCLTFGKIKKKAFVALLASINGLDAGCGSIRKHGMYVSLGDLECFRRIWFPCWFILA